MWNKMELQEHGRGCNANHQNLVTNQPLYNLVLKVRFSGMLDPFERLENSFIIMKGTKSQGYQQSWLKNLTQFHIDWYAILNVVLTLSKETVLKYIAHGNDKRPKLKFSILYSISISKINLKDFPLNLCFKNGNSHKIYNKKSILK